MDKLQEIIHTWVINNGYKILGALLILVMGYYVSKAVARGLERFFSKSARVDPMIQETLLKIIRIGVVGLTLLVFLDTVGLPISGLLTVFGAAGLAIGLALQGTLANIAAGIMLLVQRPFTIGHWVNIGGTTYIIESLGLFLTYARLPDGPKVMIPNSQVWGMPITNFSVTYRDMRRLSETVGISYQDNIDHAIAVVQRILAEDARVLKNEEITVAVGSLGESSVNLIIWAWVPRIDWWQFKLDFTKKIKEEFDKEGITIPFPQREVSIRKD